jgi:hypothetical protein
MNVLYIFYFRILAFKNNGDVSLGKKKNFNLGSVVPALR